MSEHNTFPLNDVRQRPSSRRSLVIVILVAMTVLVPFFSWYSGWFGRDLADSQVEEYLSLDAPPQKTQHALEEVAKRLTKGDPSAFKFRDRVVAMKDHPRFEVRRNVAWTMGHDPVEAYHVALKELLLDEDVGVRRMAACSLSKFNDPIALPVLREMLSLVEIKAPIAGKVKFEVAVGEAMSLGRDVATIRGSGDKEAGVRPPFNGVLQARRVSDGATVEKDAVIAVMNPGSGTVENALVALSLVGTPEDARLVEPYAAGKFEDMPAGVQVTAKKVLGRLRK